jgi:hypothetical protein
LPVGLFVSYLALNLLGNLWWHGLHSVFFSGVLRRFLHQLIFALGPSDIIAAGHHVSATEHFGHGLVLLMDGNRSSAWFWCVLWPFKFFVIELFKNRKQSWRQVFSHARAIVLSQLLANSFFRLTPIKPFA